MRIFIALAVTAISASAHAQANGPLDAIGSIVSRSTPIGSNHKLPPPMDNPRLPWFNYRTDSLGRPTYLDEACLRKARDYVDPCVQSAILAHRQLIDSRNEQERLAAEQLEKDVKAEKLAQANVKRSADEAARPRLSPLQASEHRIRQLKQQLAGARRALAKEDEVAAVSGVTNKATRYQLGEMIVFTNHSLEAEYSRYRKLGGRKALSAI